MTEAIFDQPIEIPVDSVVSPEDLYLPVDQAYKHFATVVHLQSQSESNCKKSGTSRVMVTKAKWHQRQHAMET